MQALIVSRNEQSQELLKLSFCSWGDVDIVTSGRACQRLVKSIGYDLLFLDTTLPGLDSYLLCRQLRERGNQSVILLMSWEHQDDDLVRSLDAGADAHIVLPMCRQELEAQMRSLLRRKDSTFSNVLVCGDLRYDLQLCHVTYKGQPIALTAKEFALLALFLGAPEKVFSVDEILTGLWLHKKNRPSAQVVKAHIKRLRQKLKQFDADHLLETVYGAGYRINPHFHAPEQNQSSLDTSLSASSNVSADCLPEIVLAQPSSLDPVAQAIQSTKLLHEHLLKLRETIPLSYSELELV
jgi:two-component system, OmpR family, response regulator